MPEHWGKGYATEAVSEIISYGFHTIHLKRIGAIVFLENEASNQVLLKLGFEKEGVLKIICIKMMSHMIRIFTLY